MDLQSIQFTGTHILSALIFSPLIGVLWLLCCPSHRQEGARVGAILSSTVTFLLSLGMLSTYPRGSGGFHFTEHAVWLPSIGARYVLGIDGISLWLIVLTTLLTWLVILGSRSITKKLRAYLSCILLLEVGMLGTFAALDGLTFYIFWELMLVPMYFLIGVWGGARRTYAAIKFVLYTALGSLLMLVAIVYLAYLHHLQFEYSSFFLADWMNLQLTHQEEYFLFAAFALAFAIKIPLFPLHTWLPDAHVEAPTGGSVILAGVMLKMGLYGLIRFCLPLFPQATVAAQPLFAVLALIGIVYGALVAWVQTDMKKLVAYSSVSHLGFCVLGYATLNLYGMQGAVLQMLNHGISTAALFLVVGVLYDRKHTRLIADYQGLAHKVPLFSAVFLVFTLSSIGLPLTNGFVGEFLILLGTSRYNMGFAAIAVSGVVLGAVYMLSLYRRVIFGAFDEKKNGDLTDLNLRESMVFVPLLLMVFFVGLYPKPILNDLSPATKGALDMLRFRPPMTASGQDGVIDPALNDGIDFVHTGESVAKKNLKKVRGGV